MFYKDLKNSKLRIKKYKKKSEIVLNYKMKYF